MSLLSTEVPKIMVFRPTLEEMKDFSAYITHMESKGAHLAGVAKVIPPKEFVPRKDYSTVDLTIPAPIQQEVMGHKGVFTQFNIQKKPLSFAEYKKMALSDKFKTPDHFDYDDLERKYWRNLAYNSPIYGADVSGTIYDKDWDIWNINRLQTVLDVIEEEEGVKIEGVNTAYLYFGMWKTTFAWHTEDMDLYSINYIHFGAPKTWYAIPPIHAKRLERLAAGFYPQNFQICSNFLRHKMTVISPQILKKYSIPFNKITQECGEFMITFPYGYHSGFNHGFNCAESTNFASNRWINFGKRANCCTCARDSVKINMDPFVRIMQADRYEAWKAGDDYDYIEDIDGPMSDAQFVALMERKPHKKEAAMLKRKISQMPNKPRRHPVHKRGDNQPPSSPNKASPVKRGRMCSTVTLSGGVFEPVVDVEADVVSGRGDASSHNIREVLQRKIKEKTKAKSAASSKGANGVTSSPTKVKSEAGVKPAPTVAKIKLSLVSNSGVKKEFSVDKAGGRKPVKVRTKRASEELRLKEDSKKSKKVKDGGKKAKKEERKSKDVAKEIVILPSSAVGVVELENKADAAVVRTEHAYSYDMSSTSRHAAATSSTNNSSSASSSARNSSNTHSAVAAAAGHGSKGAALSRRGKSKKKKKKKSSKHSGGSGGGGDGAVGGERTKHRPKTNKGRRMKDFTAQEYALMKTWARSMFGLWVTQPNSFEMEQAYNASLADQKPGCCVCMLFYNEKIDSQDWVTGDRAFSSSMSKVAGTTEDRRMVVLAPEYCFAASAENRHPSCVNSILSPEGRSPILTCSQCMIAVHASCYGEMNIPEAGEEWKCTRCREGDLLAECCLCNLRGGALKLTSEDTWAHIVCAMAIPEVTFENVEAREPINIDRISPARLKLKCFFCRTFIKHSPRNGSCIQCSVGKCALSFHVTCAHAAGVIMEASDWPFSVYATCLRHPFPNRDLPRERPLRELKYGEKVIAKYKNNRYYKCNIVGERDQLFYHVLFDDGTFSDNLFAQDIESHNCIRDGDPKKNAAVKVRWTDNELYNGKFVRSYYVKLYDVEFENEAVVTVKREDVYAQEEPLPKRVQTRFSHASDMQHEDFLENKVVPEKYRHLPCRDEHESDEDEDENVEVVLKQEDGASLTDDLDLEESKHHVGSGGYPNMAAVSGSQSDALLSSIAAAATKTELTDEGLSSYGVKSEPGMSLAGSSSWISPVKTAWGESSSMFLSSSPGVQQQSPVSTGSPRTTRQSPVKSLVFSPSATSIARPPNRNQSGPLVHHAQPVITGTPPLVMNSLNVLTVAAAGSSRSGSTTPASSTSPGSTLAMSPSETAALAALATMSSQSMYLPSPGSSRLSGGGSSFNQR